MDVLDGVGNTQRGVLSWFKALVGYDIWNVMDFADVGSFWVMMLLVAAVVGVTGYCVYLFVLLKYHPFYCALSVEMNMFKKKSE